MQRRVGRSRACHVHVGRMEGGRMEGTAWAGMRWGGLWDLLREAVSRK